MFLYYVDHAPDIYVCFATVKNIHSFSMSFHPSLFTCYSCILLFYQKLKNVYIDYCCTQSSLRTSSKTCFGCNQSFACDPRIWRSIHHGFLSSWARFLNCYFTSRSNSFLYLFSYHTSKAILSLHCYQIQHKMKPHSSKEDTCFEILTEHVLIFTNILC